MEKTSSIQMFNHKNSVALKAVVRCLLEVNAEKIKYHSLHFINGNYEMQEWNITDGKRVDDIPETNQEYINYYWVTFAMNQQKTSPGKENQDEKIEYKIAMFHKDFDPASGNLHVLPGMVQIWKKGDGDGFIKIQNGMMTTRDLKLPSGRPGTGQIYIEDNWVPLSIARSPREKKSRNQYMLWETTEDILNYIQYVIGGNKFIEKANLRAGGRGNSKVFYGEELLCEVYKNRETNQIMKLRSGMGTYSFLKFREGEENTIVCGYKIVYIENAGYFCDFNRRINVYSKGKIGTDNHLAESPNYFVETEKGKGYWDLKY